MKSEMNLLEYNLRQLRRSYKKEYENYVVSRVFHAVNKYDDIQLVTQQYVKRPEGFALTDLYFPQFKLHVEIDEPHHDVEQNTVLDVNRELDVINAAEGHRFKRININDTNFELDKLNRKIDEIIEEILTLRENVDFKPWKLGDEYITDENKQTFLQKGYIDVEDNLRFRTIMDASNFLGQDVKGMQKAWFRSKAYPGHYFWFPKFYKNSLWDNKLVDESEFLKDNGCVFGDLIQERPLNPDIKNSHFESIVNSDIKRIVFPRFIDNLGFVVYRFMGIYEVDKMLSSVENGMIYKRVSKRFVI